MADPFEAIKKLVTCHFCMKRFTDVVKFIPDCGKSICGECYRELRNSMEESKEYQCRACDGQHILPDSEYQDCKLLLDLLDLPTEKPLTSQAKKLQLVIESVHEELARLQAFDAKEFVNRHCDELEAQVTDVAESAIKHIKEIERGLHKQIDEYRQRRLNHLKPELSQSFAQGQRLQVSISRTQNELNALSQEIESFSSKWKQYFSRLSVLASDAEVDSALAHADIFQVRMRGLEQKIRNNALRGSFMQFNPNVSFQSGTDHLGELVRMETMLNREVKEIAIQETASRTMTGHSTWIAQAILLPNGRLASCSFDETIKLWDTASGQELFTLQGHTGWVHSLALLPNGWLASGSGDKTIKLWDLEARMAVKTLRGHSGPITDLKVLKNGNLASYSCDNTIKIWNPHLSESNLLLTLRGHGNWDGYHHMGILSSDSLVTFSHDKYDMIESTLRVWDPNSGKLVKSLPTGLKEVESILALSNDQVALGTWKGVIKIVDLEDDQYSRVNENAHEEHVTRLLQLSNDNLVSAGRDNDSSANFTSIKVWNFFDLSLLQHIKAGHVGTIWSLSISQDEKLLATSSWDHTIKLWPMSVKGGQSS